MLKNKIKAFQMLMSKGQMSYFVVYTQHISQRAHAELGDKYAKHIKVLTANFDRFVIWLMKFD